MVEGPGGTHPALGAYDELLFPAGAMGSYGVRYFARVDAFLFDRTPAASSTPHGAGPPPPPPSLDRTFPIWDGAAVKNDTDCIGWSNH